MNRPPFIDILNAFVQDTGFLICVAYLMARHRTLGALFEKKARVDESIRLGLVFGLAGTMEVILPHSYSPYDPICLMTALASVTGGTVPGMVCAIATSAVALMIDPSTALIKALTVGLAVPIARPFRRFDGSHFSIESGTVAGVLTAAGGIAVYQVYGMITHAYQMRHFPAELVANGFGMAVMISMFNEAWVRQNAERHRLEAERSRALASEAQLGALRARLHPHFLYNALASIAGLCAVAPDRAQEAIVSLGDLMRRTLEASATSVISLKAERRNVESYVLIEQTRLEERLIVCWDIDAEALTAQIPPLSIQTLVENAVNHGVATRIEPVTVTISARQSARGVLVSVRDDGPGFKPSARPSMSQMPDVPVRGMQILSRQLELQHGRRARLRVFSRPGAGTLVAFRIPASPILARRA